MYTYTHETSEALNQNNSSYCLCTHSNGGGLLSSLFLFSTINPTNASSISSDLEVTINSVLELSLTTCNSPDSSQVIVNITPSSTGSFKSNCQTVTVHTNMPGYTLTARSTGSNPNYNSGTTTNSLLYLNPTTITPTPTIPSTTNPTTTPAILSNNTWGFAVEALNSTDTPSNQASTTFNFDSSYTIDNPNNTYAELPTSDTTIYQTDQFPITVTDHTFYYAARLTPDTVAGSYATTITYTAVGETIPDPVYYLTDIVRQARVTTMQELTSTLCATATYDTTNGGINDNNTVILTDIRNNQDYRVRKMPDNKCWMIDNLKLATPGTELVLTSDDTDIPEGAKFIIPANAVTGSANRVANGVCVGGMASGTDGYLTCDGVNTQSDANNAFIAYVEPSGTVACSTNVGTNSDTYSVDSLTKCGYLYNWYTATAGTGNYSMSSGNTTSSICPINWRLPSAGTGIGTAANEFATLNGAMIGTGPSIINDATTQPNWRPDGLFSGAYAGYRTSNTGRQGSYGYYWSSTAHSFAGAVILDLEYDKVYPGSNGGDTKSIGRSVRCAL